MKKQCLVTGGAGFIGSHLVEELLENGYKVRVLDDLSNGKLENLKNSLKHDSFEFQKGSVIREAHLKKAFYKIDVVFHLACLGVRHSLLHPLDNHAVNATGTLMTLEAARKARIKKFIYCSSSEIYGTARHVPMTESHPANPHTIYGASKLAGENYTRAYALTYKMPTVILRPFNAYGPNSHHEGDCGEVIPKSIVRTLAGKNILIFGDGTQTRDFTYVRDTARALRLAAEKPIQPGEIFNVGQGCEIKILDLAKKIQDIAPNSASRIQHTKARPGDVLRLFADSSKFQRTFSWKPLIDFDSGLQKTFDYFKLHPDGIQKLMSEEIAHAWKS